MEVGPSQFGESGSFILERDKVHHRILEAQEDPFFIEIVRVFGEREGFRASTIRME
jgi:hypothetical protein